MFSSEEDSALSEMFINKGYVIVPVGDSSAFQEIKNIVFQCSDIDGNLSKYNPNDWLNNIHNQVSASQLNEFRMKVINKANAHRDFRSNYYLLAKRYLEILVGNELAMQLRINLSIQLPGDSSSLLPTHADVWSGDSPFEVVVWTPLVDCYGTKAMYILPPEADERMRKDFTNFTEMDSEALFQHISKEVHWLEIKAGQLLIFNQNLPHGNRVNLESETRWSMNCRFKGIFTPYGDKKIGEFFEPITLKPASRIGMQYRFPKLG